MRVAYLVAIAAVVALAVAQTPADLGIDVTNPAFKNLFPNGEAGCSMINGKAEPVVTTFDDLLKNYFGKRGTLVVDAREFKDALTIVGGAYIVPASVFDHHKSIFPAARNYFIYGPAAAIRSVGRTLMNERGATFVRIIELPEGKPLQPSWQGDVQVKKPPYYEMISSQEMYSRYVDGEPQSQDPILVDVRSPQEYRKLRIKYAVNVPYEKLVENFDVLPVTQKVYLYGQNTTLGTQAAELFAKYYRTYTMPISGGLDEWKSRGYPTDSDRLVERQH